MLRLALSFGFLLLGGCRTHALREGTYTLVPETVVSDGCGLGPVGAPWQGALQVSGDIVRMRLSFLDAALTGWFKSVSGAFTLDGSVPDVPQGVQGEDCTLDWVYVHLDGATTGAQSFAGTLSIRYEDVLDRCRCELVVDYSASPSGE